jgi:Family of unknown function (DUF6035)
MGSSAIDPLAQANPAKELKIFEILDCDTGEFIDSREFIRSHKYGEIFEPRHEIRARWKTDNPKYVCSDCQVAISLLAGVERNWFFFRHLIEDGRCAAKTRGSMNQFQINAVRYNSVVESEPHRRFKQLMYDCASADDSFSDMKIERVRTSTTKKGAWRKPDVSALRGDLFHAFEVQLSTTFFDVVLERQSFYRADGAILIWVLPDFDPDDRSMMEDDIFFHNNSNVMVLNEAIAFQSISEGKLHFGCWYRLPSADGETYSESWQYEIVPFDALTLDIERQRVFYFDHEVEKEAVNLLITERKKAEQKARVEKQSQKRIGQLRDRFEEFWLEHARGKPETSRAWDDLINSNWGAYDEFGLPQNPFDDAELSALLNALYWAKHQRQVGWEHEDIVKVGHHVFDKHQPHFALFAHCLWHFKQIGVVNKIDSTGKLKAKIQSVRDTPISDRQKFKIDTRHSKLIELLFPEPFLQFSSWISS